MLVGFLFGCLGFFLNYTSSLPNLSSGTPHPATPLPLTTILVIATLSCSDVANSNLLRCSMMMDKLKRDPIAHMISGVMILQG